MLDAARSYMHPVEFSVMACTLTPRRPRRGHGEMFARHVPQSVIWTADDCRRPHGSLVEAPALDEQCQSVANSARLIENSSS